MNEDSKDYDIYLRIGLDGSFRLVDDFANEFDRRVYNETLHTHVITTNVHLDNYIIKVELLKAGWSLRPNVNYYSYIDGAILVCDLSHSDILKEIKELSDEYSNEYGNYVTDKMPIMIVAEKESRNDILKEAKTYVEDVLLFDETLTKENTIEILKEYIEYMYKLLNFKDLPNKQFELMMKRAIRLYLYEISKSIIDGKQVDGVLNEDTILSFLSLSNINLKWGRYGYYRYHYGYYGRYGDKGKIKGGVFKKDENEHVIIANVGFDLPKNLQNHLRKAISNIKNITNHNDLEKYYKKINKQLNYIKEFDKKALNISDFIHMIDLAFLLIEKLKNINLNCTDTNSNETNLVNKIDQILHNWIEDYTKIAQKFKQFYEGLSTFNKNNKNNNLVIFNIQEELLTEVDNVRKHLTKKSKELDNILYLNKEDIKKKIDKDFYYIIQLKSLYNLTTGLEYTRSRLELFDPTFIQKILDFYEKLIYELELNNDLIKIFRENEPYVKDYCLNRIIKNLAKIDCLVDNFYKHIIAKTYDKIEFERMNKG